MQHTQDQEHIRLHAAWCQSWVELLGLSLGREYGPLESGLA